MHKQPRLFATCRTCGYETEVDVDAVGARGRGCNEIKLLLLRNKFLIS
jgi:hypothetical protein